MGLRHGVRDLTRRPGTAGRVRHVQLQAHPEGDSRHEQRREVMEIVQKARQRKTERRHFLHHAPTQNSERKTRTLLCAF